MRPELFRIPGTSFMVPGYGAMIVIAFLVGTWWMTRRATKVKCDPDVVLSLALISLIFGWLGGRLFYVIHYWKSQFAHQPAQILNLTAGGFEVYGGILTASAVCILYLLIRRLPVRLYADLTAPSLLFGMGIGRIGCFLVGCCWGAECPAGLPWAVHFPMRSAPFLQQWEDRLVTVPADLLVVLPNGASTPVWPFAEELGKKFPSLDLAAVEAKLAEARKKLSTMPAGGLARGRGETELVYFQAVLDHFRDFDITPAQVVQRSKTSVLRSRSVHPAQIYSAVGPLLLAWLLSAWFYRRRRHGSVMALAMILYGIERFIEEMVRSDNPLDTFGLTVSQGVSILVVAGGVLWWMLLKKMPPRSSRPGIPVKNQPSPEPISQPA